MREDIATAKIKDISYLLPSSISKYDNPSLIEAYTVIINSKIKYCFKVFLIKKSGSSKVQNLLKMKFDVNEKNMPTVEVCIYQMLENKFNNKY
jgi:hypothetical protein